MQESRQKGRGCLWSLFAFIVLGFVGFFALIFIIAVFSSSGNILSKPIQIVKISGPIFDSDKLIREMEEARLNEKVKVIVLRIDSPGGAVGPSQELHDQVKRIRKSKKVIASMGTVAASGGYYIASAADWIVAAPGTITGSIGVIIENFGLQQVLDKVQVENRIIKSGRYKDAGNPFRSMDDEEKKYFQDISDNMYERFLSDVGQNRNINIDKMHEIAQGRIYTGTQALEIHLVDQIGNLYDAIDVAKTKAGLPENAEVMWPREPTGFENLFGGESGASVLEMLKNKFLGKALPLTIL